MLHLVWQWLNIQMKHSLALQFLPHQLSFTFKQKDVLKFIMIAINAHIPQRKEGGSVLLRQQTQSWQNQLSTPKFEIGNSEFLIWGFVDSELVFKLVRLCWTSFKADSSQKKILCTFRFHATNQSEDLLTYTAEKWSWFFSGGKTDLKFRQDEWSSFSLSATANSARVILQKSCWKVSSGVLIQGLSCLLHL